MWESILKNVQMVELHWKYIEVVLFAVVWHQMFTKKILDSENVSIFSQINLLYRLQLKSINL